MKETIRLFDKDAYATEFESTVISCESREGGSFAVILEETLFFPEEGGQSPDKGTLEGCPVVDVQIKKGVITHMVKEALEPGARVTGRICWEHRFSNMQQHSGEHIFSGLVYRLYGCRNVGFHLSDQNVTMDFDAPLTQEELEAVETEANRAIVQNIETKVSYPTQEELNALEYRSKIAIDGQVRIVTIPGYDVCACCAPHVRRTGEIGLLKIMGVTSHKGGVRVNMLCGFRALQSFREKNRIVSQLVSMLSTQQEDLPRQVERLKDTIYGLKGRLAEAAKKRLEATILRLPEDQESLLLFVRDVETEVARDCVNTWMGKHSGICAIFMEQETGGCHFILGSLHKDCREIAAVLRTGLGAKCGGSRTMIQGSLEAGRERVEEVLELSAE